MRDQRHPLALRTTPVQDVYPNIILIVLDSLRADRLSCYGYHRQTTPNLDQLAREGCRFDQAITPACWTVPSHASLFTGLHPCQHGAHEEGLPASAGPTLAETAQAAGYYTVAVSGNPWISRARGFGRGFVSFHDSWRRLPRFRRGQVVGWLGKRLGWTDNGARAANAIARAEIRACPRPFFLFMNYLETHSPYMRFWPVGRRFVTHGLHLGARWRMWRYHRRARHWDRLTLSGPEQLRLLGDLYDEEVSYVDRRVGDLLGDLEQFGLLNSSIVIVTSDHGENLGDHRLVDHHFCLYDSLLRVPLIVRWPELLPAGEVLSAQVQLTDLALSLKKLVGLSNRVRSNEARPSLFRPAAMNQTHWPAYAQYRVPWSMVNLWRERNVRFDFAPHLRDLWATRSRGFKLVASSDGRRELYDLAADPKETRNIYSEQSDTARRLEAEMERWLDAHPPLADQQEAASDAEAEARLRDLGYL